MGIFISKNRTLAVIIALLCPSLSVEILSAQTEFNVKHVKFLEEHCADCHQGDDSEGGFDLDKLTTSIQKKENFVRWERVFDRMQAGEMPPKDAEQPDADLQSKFLTSVIRILHNVHKEQKGTVLRRLNRVEYQNTLNDLFGVDLKLAELLPEDGRAHEFDNVGSALSLSMVHLKKYMDAIGYVLDASIARTSTKPDVQRIEGSYANSREGNQFIGKVWKKLADGSVVRFSGGGYPSGMIRSTGVRDAGRYRVTVTGYAYQSSEPITCSVGGTTFKRGAEIPTYGYFTFKPGKPQTIQFEARIESNYMIQIEPYGIQDPDRYKRKSIEGYKGPGLAIQSVVLEGPLLDEFPSRGHRLIFDGIQRKEIEPRDPKQKLKSWYKPRFEIVSSNEGKDSRQAIQRLAAFAFRRKVKAEELEPYLQLFEQERKKGSSFETALRQSATAIFCSPSFLFLNEPSGKLDDFAVASRLSYFLARSTPDRELLAAASAGRLTTDPREIVRHAERLMAKESFQRFVTDFADSWLNLREMDFTVPDAQLFPEYDPYLRFSMPQETQAFLREMIQANLPIRSIVKSDFAMVNDRLAKLYGLDGAVGPEIRKVGLEADAVRGGLLTQASVLKVSANGTNTSPVVRGVWVLERILGVTPQPPPPGIPGVEPDIRGATTLREQLKKHRNLTNCQSCHQMIDPPGFALEVFNPIGGYRDFYRSLGEGERLNTVVNGRKVRYRKGPDVDGSGELRGLGRFKNFVEFRDRLAENEAQLAEAFAEKLLTFATGREMGFSDHEEIKQLVKSIQPGGYRTRDLMLAIIQSSLFLSK